jgi:hypothetical protein
MPCAINPERYLIENDCPGNRCFLRSRSCADLVALLYRDARQISRYRPSERDDPWQPSGTE